MLSDHLKNLKNRTFQRHSLILTKINSNQSTQISFFVDELYVNFECTLYIIDCFVLLLGINLAVYGEIKYCTSDGFSVIPRSQYHVG